MITYTCDGCGKAIPQNALRYTVRIDVKAAYDVLEIGLADLVRDHDQEIRDLMRQLSDKDPKEIEETVYKGFNLDLCPACQKKFIRDPLRFNPQPPPGSSDFDIDSFLKSLGYGGDPTPDPSNE